MIRQHCSLFRGTGVWLSATENNKPSTTRCSARLSLPPYLPLSPPFLSNPSPPLILSFSLQPFYCRPSFGALLLLLYAMPPIPQAHLPHLVVYLYVFLSLCSPFQSSAICLYLLSRCICLSVSEVWETGVRGLCQTNQQYSLTAIPLCSLKHSVSGSVLCSLFPPLKIQQAYMHTHSQTRGSFHHSREHVIGKASKSIMLKASKHSFCLAIWGWINPYAIELPNLNNITLFLTMNVCNTRTNIGKE